MGLWLFFILSFICGFLFTWYATDDLGSDVVFFTDSAELQEMCMDGLRKGQQ
jgi:hypothetical protein